MVARTAAVCLAVALAASAVEIPAGTELHVRLETPLSAAKAKAGQAVETVIIRPVISNGAVVVPGGARVTGEVKEAKAAQTNQRAQLLIAFDKIAAKTGKSAKLEAQITSVDNSRETVDDKGTILGILPSETLSAQMDSGINKVAQRYPGFADILQAVKGGVVKESDPDINYDAGVEMTLKLAKPLNWEPPPESAPQLHNIEPAADLVTMVNAQPFRTKTEEGGTPSDLTNLMFLGTEQQVQAAFTAAGWARPRRSAAHRNWRPLAPLSRCAATKRLLCPSCCSMGSRPTWFSKSRTTRLRSGITCASGGGPGRSTGDRSGSAPRRTISVLISRRSSTRLSTRSIRRSTANARKVVNDLLFTGKVTGLALVERPDVPRNTKNGTGDDLITDGRMAILEF